MKIRSALIGFSLVTVCYLFALLWADSQKNIFNEIPRLASILPLLFLISLISYIVRYARWHWLLRRAGQNTPCIRGFLAYLSGFAFTATPGKVGELVRMRYLIPMGVPPELVISTFIFERAFDLVAVLLLASIAIDRPDFFIFVLLFVAAFISTLIFFAYYPNFLLRVSESFLRRRFLRIAKITMTLCNGLRGILQWMNMSDIAIALGLGLVAWGITSYGFLILLNYLGLSLPFVASFAIYPLAMLAGAASMLPGGLGSTEIVIVALLDVQGVQLSVAAIAAVGIRLATIWFAILCGFISIVILEFE
jgi:uncharacterized protein (TIRG00374 family)